MVEMPRAEIFKEANELVNEQERPRSLRQVIRRIAVVFAGLILAAGASYFGYQYWTVGQYLESTDDAYMKADYTIVAPKVSGYIANVLVKDNEKVAVGQVLAQIADDDFRTSLSQARADVEAAEASIRNIDAQLVLQRSLIEQAKATVQSTEASLNFAKLDAERFRELAKTGAGPVQHAQQTQSTLDQTTAQLQRDRASLLSEENKVDVLSSTRSQSEAQRDRARAIEHQAELNLSYTTIKAPVDGTVGARSLRVGQYVSAGTQLMAVVPLRSLYLVANFKETQLSNVRSGQPVEIEVDGMPGIRIKGHVDSVSPASGLEFALLPPDNATGNFTKIVQRIPVRISLDDGDPNELLRSGMSAEPTIDTKAAALAANGQENGLAGIAGGKRDHDEGQIRVAKQRASEAHGIRPPS